jgi:hypothetical protein
VALLVLLWAAVLGASGRAFASAQARTAAVVTGTVSTLEGKVRLPGVPVTLATPAGDPVGSAVTDQNGQFRIEAPSGGSYRLKASLDGFRTVGLDLALADGITRAVSVELRLLELEQTIDVTPTTDITMNLTKPLSPSETIDGRWLSVSAISSGSVAASLRWLPGVAPYGREWAIKGGRPNQIGIQVDSAQALDPAAGVSPVQLPGDAVSAIQVLANPYAVEFGRFSSGVIVVATRRGGDKWTAAVNNFLPGLLLKRGNNPFIVIGVESADPRLMIAGPILKNRLFLAQSTQFRYDSGEVASRPQDERRVSKSLSSFTRLDLVVNSRHSLSGTFTMAPENTSAVTLSTFDPPDATADLRQRVYRVGISETAQLSHSVVLESLVHFTRYRTSVDGHGDAAEMTLAPESNSGIYFNRQTRLSNAWQVSETLSGFIAKLGGKHLYKVGIDVMRAGYQGDHTMRPINVLREDGTLTRRLTAASSHLQFEATDVAVFLQDRWLLNDRFSMDLGVRVERDGVFERINVAPRFGAALALNEARTATIRGGWGYFYERTPTLAGAFPRLATLYESAYSADGRTMLAPPVGYAHAFDGPLETPRSVTWNLGYEHQVAPWLSVRFNHLQRHGSHELVMDVGRQGSTAWIELESAGRARYRDTELGAHLSHGPHQDLDVSYTRSSSWADLNDVYGYYLNMTANPIVRANQFGPTDTDTPNRFVARGRARVGRNWSFEVAGEVRSGVPYSAVNEQLEFVGPRNGRRFPSRAVLDVSVERRFRIRKLEPWIGFVFVNALNSFIPVDVQRNVASPRFGSFYSSAIRQIRGFIHFHP